VGYWWWQGRMRPIVTLPEVSPASATAQAEPLGEVVVHVRGRVERPGVVTLPAGSRVVDAIDAVGGVRVGASTGDLNLARILVDGEQVSVGIRRAVDAEPGAPAAAGDAGADAADARIDLNTATAADLEGLPGIGPVLAQRIVQWREDNGRFTDVEVLGEVSGIGDALMVQLRPLVSIG
jgi:competence protein ComEA